VRRGDAQPRVPGGVRDRAAPGRAEERAEPAAGVDRAGPAVAEGEPLQLPERRRPVLVPLPDAAAVVVHGVVAAEQDAVVAGEPVVVELVGRVAEALTAGPADRREL